jgi:hypothetical protein
MKKIPICIVCLFLAIGAKVQAATILETLDPNSTEGNYYGGIYFSFSVAQDAEAWNGTTNHIFWTTTTDNSQFNDGSSQLGLTLALGLAEGPDELNILSTINVVDPNMNIYGYLGSQGNDGFEERGFLFNSGVTNDLVYVMSDHSEYYDFNRASNETCSLGFTVDINFDGSVGIGTGSWYLNYTTPQITPTPEPAAVWQLALGGFGLWLARARRRCGKS